MIAKPELIDGCKEDDIPRGLHLQDTNAEDLTKTAKKKPKLIEDDTNTESPRLLLVAVADKEVETAKKIAKKRRGLCDENDLEEATNKIVHDGTRYGLLLIYPTGVVSHQDSK